MNGCPQKIDEYPQGEVSAQAVPADLDILRSYFKQSISQSTNGHALQELRNPHVESLVSREVKLKSRHSAVLIAVTNEPEPQILVTKRQSGIRFGGHWCLPGGTKDEADLDYIATSLREAEEEIGLASSQVEVLGQLGSYYTQAGYRIIPVVGIVDSPYSVSANPSEVEIIAKVPLKLALSPSHYQLTWHGAKRAHFSFEYVSSNNEQIRIAGPTVSIMIGLLEGLSAYLSSMR